LRRDSGPIPVKTGVPPRMTTGAGRGAFQFRNDLREAGDKGELSARIVLDRALDSGRG
jgi:hypothetical protein